MKKSEKIFYIKIYSLLDFMNSYKKPKIAILFMGGTMSYFRDNNLNAEFPISTKEELLEIVPEIDDIADIEVYSNIIKKTFYLKIQDWKKVFDIIQRKSKKFDGFVVVQESDSVLIGANILGFLTAQFSKPIVFTSSVTPFQSYYGNLAENNILGAIRFAGKDIGETTVFSHGSLIRASRAKRRNIETEHPFYSSFIDNIGEIKNKKAILGIHRIRRNNNKIKFPYKYPSKNIFFMRFFPGHPIEHFDILYENNFDAVVIQSLGYGSIPLEIKRRLEQFDEIDTPVIIIAEHDAPSRRFSLNADREFKNNENIVVIRNMTVFATIIKTHFILENFSKEEFQEKMIMNFCGDILQE